jgi:L-ascorbate metabolism protein UlaG (beta-lactamase superfamily)
MNIRLKNRKSKLILVALMLLTILCLYSSCSSTHNIYKENKMRSAYPASIYVEDKFYNYQPEPSMLKASKIFPVLWEYIVSDSQKTPDTQLPVRQIDFSKINAAKDDELQVTWVGHSSQIINMDGYKILTDPVYEKSITMVGPTRYNGEAPLEIDELPNIDLVLISHNHYDHLNKYTIEKIHHNVSKFIVPLAVGEQLEAFGVAKDKIIEMDWWEEIQVFHNLKIVFTPTQHFSGRGIFDRNETLWGSFVIMGHHHKIYFSGDSGYFEGFKEIGNKYGPFDLTMMECGAYNEKWRFVHMMPEETVQAHIDLKGNILQPIHWGTFSLALHPWYEPMVRVFKAATERNIQLFTPIVGETVLIDENLKSGKWWEEVESGKSEVKGGKSKVAR